MDVNVLEPASGCSERFWPATTCWMAVDVRWQLIWGCGVLYSNPGLR